MMSVFICESDAFEKMCQVEGTMYGMAYERFKTEEAFGDCSFDAFLEKWKEAVFQCPRIKQSDSYMHVNGNGAIYGIGGWNRYLVRWTGEIVLLGISADQESRDKAREVGFAVQ